MVEIYYTADIIRPDGSDTGVYGDACGPGEGAELVSGWIDPDWSRDTVYANREDVRPDVWTADDGPMIDWIVQQLHARLGLIDTDGGDRSYYAAESDSDPYTGVDVRMAAHVDAPPVILAAVAHAVARCSRYPYPAYA